MNDKNKAFVSFFTKQEPKRVIEAIQLINKMKEKSIADLELTLKLTNNPKIKQIIKNMIKMKVDEL